MSSGCDPTGRNGSDCGRGNNSPKAAHALVPRACEYVTSHGRGDIAGVTEDLEIGRQSWII